MSAGKLPEGWVESELSALGHIVTGKTPSTKEPSNFGGDIPFIKPGDLDLGGYITATADTLTEKGLAFIPTLPTNSIVVTCIGNLGKVGITTIRSASNQQINALIPSEKLNVKFIYYQILTLKPWLESQSAATTIAIVNKSKFSQAPFKFPPISEQKIIAEKLDTLLAQVVSTKARLEQIPQILKRFRQAVLASALKGELTSKWRISNKTGQDISSFKDSVKKYRFENWVKEQEQKFLNKDKQPKNDSWKKKYQEAIISQDITGKEIPDGWLFEPLDGLVYISARIGWKGLKASEYTVKGPLFLSVHSLNYGKKVNLAQAYHISEHRYNESPEIMLKNDDILLCKDGAGIGKLAIVKNLNEPATINSSLLLIRAGDFFIPEYLFYFLSGPDMQNLVKERMTGSAVPHLFQRDVKEFVLEVPPLKEQHEIVRRVEQLFAYADTIEKQVNNALARVNNLTQSILAKAFRGELTAQWRAENPDLISGENSAAALLEKIKAERAASGGKKAAHKKA
ncbi:restriction endonuclease subunit S [Enterobacter roggenkampii]|uniref:restriction endonuclease subunit S n=1 Tax=Enterobacter roggenkampii TaxID=1812935 RepID=UPI000C1E7DEF|nr:restriction endonuclease subunit S [Enterobacter roggenkampii]ELK1820396.1 restriction endonuclease subunit S [Enterobacter roggenkampii]ELK1822982.1 restriction endonuclease subunit S [Enterobacter roggenkampii]MBW7749749.1 restriction endonuclease subunit S [Enterobacter roggenkampii]MCU6165256.1 restriction endonuclease subunit S [Enterobacter roggenkampii]PJD07483.1 restriction endonuclease [Enterobacter roggenkampii]